MPKVLTATGSPDDLSRVVKSAYLSVGLIRTMVDHGKYLEALFEIDDLVAMLKPYQDR